MLEDSDSFFIKILAFLTTIILTYFLILGLVGSFTDRLTMTGSHGVIMAAVSFSILIFIHKK